MSRNGTIPMIFVISEHRGASALRRLIVAVVLMTAAGCASRGVAPRFPSVPPAGSSGGLEVREGLASYYAQRFHGRTTASGEEFDNEAMVAAHPSYPFGSLVRVTNLRNRRSINVRIVD